MVLQKDTQLPESVPETTSMASIRFVWTLALIAAFTHAGIAGDNDPPVVQTKYGQLSGKVVNTQKGSCDVFLGVPYAAPPIGDLRWQVWPQSCDSVQILLHECLRLLETPRPDTMAQY